MKYFFIGGGLAVFLVAMTVAAAAQGPEAATNRAINATMAAEDLPVSDIPSDSALPDEDLATGEPQPSDFSPNLEERIDRLTLSDAEIRQAADVLEEKTGLIFTMAEEVKGTVSLDVEDIQVRDALRVLCGMLDAAYLQEYGIVQVMTEQKYISETGTAFSEATASRIVPVQHVAPQDMLPRLSDMKDENTRIYIDQHRPAVVLIGNPLTLAKIAERIQQEDILLEERVVTLHNADPEDVRAALRERYEAEIKDMQVLPDGRLQIVAPPDIWKSITPLIKGWDAELVLQLKVRAIEIILSDEHQDGINWPAVVSAYRPVAAPHNLPNQFQEMGIGMLSEEDYMVLLEALDVVGEVEELFFVTWKLNSGKGMTVWLNMTSDKEGGKLQAQPDQISTPQPVGQINLPAVPLHLKAHRTLEGEFSLDLALAEPEHQTTIKIEDRQTLVIGGIFQEQDWDVMRKFPLLGDLPFLGFIFRTRSTATVKVEYVMFVQPTVVEPFAPDTAGPLHDPRPTGAQSLEPQPSRL